LNFEVKLVVREMTKKNENKTLAATGNEQK